MGVCLCVFWLKAGFRLLACSWVPSRAKCENGASSKIVLFVTGRKGGVIDEERLEMNRSLCKREQREDSSFQSSGIDKLRNAPK